MAIETNGAWNGPKKSISTYVCDQYVVNGIFVEHNSLKQIPGFFEVLSLVLFELL